MAVPPPPDELVGTNTLVLVEAHSAAERSAWEQFVTHTTGGEDHVIAVVLDACAQRWLDYWMTAASAEPVALDLVTNMEQSELEIPTNADVHTTPAPGELTGIGITISTLFSEAPSSATQTRLCVQSLTKLLKYADMQPLSQFLHVLTARVANANGIAQYHLDPSVVSQESVATLSHFVDAIVRHTDDGWDVHQ